MCYRATQCLHGWLLVAKMCLECGFLMGYWAKLSTMMKVIYSNSTYKRLLSHQWLTMKYSNNKVCWQKSDIIYSKYTMYSSFIWGVLKLDLFFKSMYLCKPFTVCTLQRRSSSHKLLPHHPCHHHLSQSLTCHQHLILISSLRRKLTARSDQSVDHQSVDIQR